MKLFRISRLVCTIAALSTAMLTAGLATEARASSHCQPFPKVAAWGDYTHKRVSDIVTTRLNGDWGKYIAHLDERLRLVRDVHKQGRALALTHANRRYEFQGIDLAIYVGAAEERLRVVKCLAREASITQLDQFATAAGPDTPAKPAATEVTELKDSGIDVHVETSCESGLAIFKITNLGETWPMRGTIGVYRLGNGTPLKVFARSMRFSGNQTMTFRVPPSKNPTGKLGMYINPSWVKRPFAIDRELTCL